MSDSLRTCSPSMAMSTFLISSRMSAREISTPEMPVNFPSEPNTGALTLSMVTSEPPPSKYGSLTVSWPDFLGPQYQIVEG